MKILVVDDSRAMRMIVMRTLRQAGIEAETIEAEDGAIGLAKVRDEAPDLVLSDWNMPNMSGIEFLKALRSEGDTTRFGFVTSESNPQMVQEAISSGALFMITKPFTPESFSAAISKAVTA